MLARTEEQVGDFVVGDELLDGAQRVAAQPAPQLGDGETVVAVDRPRARGTASRLIEEAEGYKARITAQAQGDAQRFKVIQTEYAKAPQVTRERMYVDTMQEVYSNVTKVLVDSKQGNNLLYLPLDKLTQQVAQGAGAPAVAPSGAASVPVPSSPSGAVDSRSRDAERSRSRETR